MLRKSGQRVERGTYWDVMSGEKIVLERDGALPGKGAYLKAPTAIVLLAAPALGLAFALFLPFIGIAMTVAAVAQAAGRTAAHAASFGWRPVEAYLAGRKKNTADRNQPKS